MLLASGCGGQRGDEPGRPALRVLFVGNSLTATNELPEVVASIAAQAGAGPLEVESVAPAAAEALAAAG